MSDYFGIGNFLNSLIAVAIIGLIMMPLGIWKLVEIIIWVCKHIHWN